MDNLGKKWASFSGLEGEGTIDLHRDSPQDLRTRQIFSAWFSKCGKMSRHTVIPGNHLAARISVKFRERRSGVHTSMDGTFSIRGCLCFHEYFVDAEMMGGIWGALGREFEQAVWLGGGATEECTII
jgi:hypothetical protein